MEQRGDAGGPAGVLAPPRAEGLSRGLNLTSTGSPGEDGTGLLAITDDGGWSGSTHEFKVGANTSTDFSFIMYNGTVASPTTGPSDNIAQINFNSHDGTNELAAHIPTRRSISFR